MSTKRRLPPITKENRTTLLCLKAKELLEFLNEKHNDFDINDGIAKINTQLNVGEIDSPLILKFAQKVKDFAVEHCKKIKERDETILDSNLKFDAEMDIMAIIRNYRSILSKEEKSKIWDLITDIITVSLRC